MNTKKVKVFWYSHRSGESAEVGEYKVTDTHEFKPRPIGRGSDFIDKSQNIDLISGV